MTLPGKLSPDSAALAAAGLLLVAGLAWVGWGERAVARVARLPAPLVGGAGPPADAEASTAAADSVAWTAPEHASDWGFDLFTPPVVYYDRATGRFTVSPAEAKAPRAEAAAEQAFGVTLLAVERQSYPLQLVGYAGEPGDTYGIFSNEITGDGIVAQAGETFADLGLEIRSLEVRREDTIVPDSMPLREIVAVAEVWDQRAGRMMRLSSAGWQWTDAPVATLRVDETGEVREVRTGDRIETQGATFEIRSVAALPPSVIVGKHHDDGTREEMTLWPENPAPTQFEGDSPFPAP